MKHKFEDNKIKNLEYSSKSSVIEFYNNLYNLKNLLRQGWLKKGIPENKCESVAEHTFAASVTALILIHQYNFKLDLEKVLIMILIHDLGEVFAGDIIPDDFIEPNDKFEKEINGLRKLFSKLNGGEKFIEIWKEFEEGATPEARFVKQIDKLEMALQANVYEKLEEKDLTEFFDSTGNVINDKPFKDIFTELLKERNK